MGIFSRKKKVEEDMGKLSSSDVHDPILTAIRDEEPFQMSANNHTNTQSLSPQMQMRDIFGKPIEMPDMSNPTRPRNERPLDTIRAFEYACTGDEKLRDEMETPRLGWTTRSNFNSFMTPHFDSNPYAMVTPTSAPIAPTSVPSSNAFSDSSNSQNSQEPTVLKKKRRGFFRRKK